MELVADVPEQERPEEPGVDPELVEAALAVFGDGVLAHYVLVAHDDERVTSIRDFRYVPYIARTGRFTRT